MINFAIIGCGQIAQRHAEHINNIGNLLCVCDIKIERAINLAEKYNCKYYDNLETLLLNEPLVDVVSICTPNGLHAEHTIMSLKYDKNVLCEKPMALSVKDCQDMITAEQESGKILSIVKQNRFNPPVMEVKKILDENIIGRVLSFQLNCFWNRNDDYYKKSDWKGKKKMDGGILFTQYSHFIDLIYWMFGDVGNIVSMLNNNHHQNIIEFEDTGVAILRFNNGLIGTVNFTINSYKKNMEGSITIFGEKGTVKIGGQYLNVIDYQCIDNYIIGDLPTSNRANDYGDYQGSMSNHDKVYQNIVEVLDKKAEVATSSLEGLKTVELIEKIYSSKI